LTAAAPAIVRRKKGGNRRTRHKPQRAVPACAPNCQAFHSLEEAAALLSVSWRTMYRLEKRGLKVSRRSGSPRVFHPHINEFMLGGDEQA
jgi:hypothetical protein